MIQLYILCSEHTIIQLDLQEKEGSCNKVNKAKNGVEDTKQRVRRKSHHNSVSSLSLSFFFTFFFKKIQCHLLSYKVVDDWNCDFNIFKNGHL